MVVAEAQGLLYCNAVQEVDRQIALGNGLEQTRSRCRLRRPRQYPNVRSAEVAFSENVENA